jgi:hypothetical protein
VRERAAETKKGIFQRVAEFISATRAASAPKEAELQQCVPCPSVSDEWAENRDIKSVIQEHYATRRIKKKKKAADRITVFIPIYICYE